MNKVDFNYYFPENFFKKEVNESFQLFLLNRSLGPFKEEEIVWGKAEKKEPDLILKDIPIELTLASTAEETTTYINDIKKHTFQTDNIEDLSIKCVEVVCKKKARKKYLTSNNMLSVLLTIPVLVWCIPLYSKIPALMPPTRFSELLKNIKNRYIDAGIFNDILIHMPGFAYDWFSFSCKEENLLKHCYLSDDEIYSNKWPYVIKRDSILIEHFVKNQKEC